MIMRKPDPSKRKNIHVITFKKIENFLKKQTEPIFKTDIVRKLRVDYNSLNLALTMIKYKTDKDGRIFIK